ncbi:Bug family tripartite tricarboxylate transporter substrate binding protein [Polynucleobacter kasalickyi]|uniref:Tripartite-type tricarboxylate transporter, receptor component TctC n=1 Tax=Polynucleobacter kasalickyi TaxID=1938817 RepID=A0A1W2BPE3_9BURK|nr:tripartite tricarboxylate transporter substrate binding protein [Polynucleobacter kasalickyi]SMC74674.1 Tripartite-type tricarboxylate transporter, receptor component TctC [Polynucleobacter kasalickyi]
MKLISWLFLLCLSIFTSLTVAQSYPNKPIKLIVPFAPGGPIDQTARIVSQKMSDLWGQTVIVENKTGANGVISAEYAMSLPADGYSLLFSVIHHTVLPSLKNNLSYNIEKDFLPVTSVAVYPIILVVNNNFPAKNIPELIKYAKENPGKLTFGHSGYGGGTYLAGELFKMQAKVDIRDIPYKGSAPAMADLLGAHVDMMFSDAPTSMQHILANKLKPLAISSSSRLALLPNLPNFTEVGLPNYNAYSWGGISVKAGTPSDIVQKLNTDIVKILNDPQVKEQFAKIGAEPQPSNTQQYGAFIHAEIAKWADMVKQGQIKID